MANLFSLQNVDNHEAQKIGNIRPRTELTRTNLLLDVFEKNASRGKLSVPQYFSTAILSQMDATAREQARKQVYHRMVTKMLSQPDLDALWVVLKQHSDCGPPTLPHVWWMETVEGPLRERELLAYEDYIDFVHYCKVRLLAPEHLKSFLSPSLFIQLLKETEPQARIMSRVPIKLIFKYVWGRNQGRSLWLWACSFDPRGTGWLTEEAFMKFLPKYNALRKGMQMEPEALKHLLLIILTRRFFFFLDPQRKGKIRIAEMVSALLTDELHFSEKKLQQSLTTSTEVDWFSPKTLTRIINHFQELDPENKATLSPEDFLKYNLNLRSESNQGGSDGPPGGGTSQSCDGAAKTVTHYRLTPCFVQRLFDEIETVKGRMDFKSFVNFTVALTYSDELQSVAYFMKILDCQHKGYVDESDIHYFYKDIQKICANLVETVEFEDIKNDIFDMIKPKDPTRFTAKDLVNSTQASTIIEMLISSLGFEKFEGRVAEA